MIEAPTCPECGRPLQRGRMSCIYCGYRLNESEQKELEAVLNDEAVHEQTAVADAILAAEPVRVMSPWARLVAKIIIIVLALAGAGFLSWVSGWNPMIIIAALALFAWPVWIVLSRL